MIGTILPKPVDPVQFRQVMAWCCDKGNGARLMEYHDRYEVAASPEEEPHQESEYVEPASIEERLDDIEDALIELAGIITGGE